MDDTMHISDIVTLKAVFYKILIKYYVLQIKKMDKENDRLREWICEAVKTSFY